MKRTYNSRLIRRARKPKTRYVTFDMWKCFSAILHTGIGIGIGFLIWGG